MSPLPPPGIILAGGRSSRMGSDKLLLPFGSGTLLSHIAGRLAPQVSGIAVNAPPSLPLPETFRRVPDTLPERPGPLAGVLAGLRDLAGRQPEETHLLTVPSDAPFFPADLALRLQAALPDPDCIAIAISAGRLHPVFGLWPVALADELEAWLGNPANRRMIDFVERHRTVTVEWLPASTPLGTVDPFMNLNTPADLAEARRLLEVVP